MFVIITMTRCHSRGFQSFVIAFKIKVFYIKCFDEKSKIIYFNYNFRSMANILFKIHLCESMEFNMKDISQNIIVLHLDKK